MTCPSCNDKGVFKISYHDGAVPDYALCLCAAGERMRKADNCGKPCAAQWEVWAHQQGIDPARVAPMEDLLTDEEMAARGFTELKTPDVALGAIAAAARVRGKR